VQVTRFLICFVLSGVMLPSPAGYSQERVGHLNYNPFQFGNAAKKQNTSTQRTTIASLNLPFFEDFTTYNSYPDPSKWLDFEVFINNTTGVNPIERGVATFDGLNKYGIPYDSFSNSDFRYCDSLTSWPINLGLNLVNPGDSLYLSFYYQAQGNGYYPQIGDSLMLYFKDQYGEYIKVWSTPGTTDTADVLPFQRVMIPITDSIFFDSAFQFRFVNIAAMEWADADWNLDYVKLDTGRNMNDTLINDIGFSSNPTNLLNDYTSMPYRQYLANPTAETASFFYDSVKNNYTNGWTDGYQYNSVCINNGAVVTPSGASGTGTFNNNSTTAASLSTYVASEPSPGPDAEVVYENTFYINSVAANDPSVNDTIVSDQVFSNYLAYDDGSAEKSYYLNLFPPDEGEIAIEFHLNQPDTMRGMAIYFGRQIPFATYKEFSIMVWSSLYGVNGSTTETILREQDLYLPGYVDSINHFWYYRFDTPLVLPAGTFYAGTIQPAEGSSDSLYFGLDVNRQGYNHVFYNVVGTWIPSSISGAIMMRPLLGQPTIATGVKDIAAANNKWSFSPNPATDNITLQFDAGSRASYQVTDIQGRTLISGTVANNGEVNVGALAPGMYLITLYSNGIATAPQKLIKL